MPINPKNAYNSTSLCSLSLSLSLCSLLSILFSPECSAPALLLQLDKAQQDHLRPSNVGGGNTNSGLSRMQSLHRMTLNPAEAFYATAQAQHNSSHSNHSSHRRPPTPPRPGEQPGEQPRPPHRPHCPHHRTADTLRATAGQRERSVVDQVREVFIVHVGGTRCVPSSPDPCMNRQARITLSVECIRTCIFLCLFDVEIQLRVRSLLTLCSI